IEVEITATIREPLAHLRARQPSTTRYPADLSPLASGVVQEVEAVKVLDANLLVALILIRNPKLSTPDDHQIIANPQHDLIDIGHFKGGNSRALQQFRSHPFNRRTILKARGNDRNRGAGIDAGLDNFNRCPEDIKLPIQNDAIACQGVETVQAGI